MPVYHPFRPIAPDVIDGCDHRAARADQARQRAFTGPHVEHTLRRGVTYRLEYEAIFNRPFIDAAVDLPLVLGSGHGPAVPAPSGVDSLLQQAGHLAVTSAGTACSSTSAMRAPAIPSHSSGTLACIPFRPSASIAASRIRWGAVPTSRLVPFSMVIGLSVFSRTVRQATPRIVVSS